MIDRLTVIVSGPQGCGKSTILDSLVRDLRQRGAKVISDDEGQGLLGVDLGEYEVLIKEVSTDQPSLFDDRENWLQIGARLFQETGGSEEGFKRWAELSERSTKFDLSEQERIWNSFKPNYELKLKSGAVTGMSIRGLLDRPAVDDSFWKVGDRLSYRFPYSSETHECVVRITGSDRVRIETIDEHRGIKSAWIHPRKSGPREHYRLALGENGEVRGAVRLTSGSAGVVSAPHFPLVQDFNTLSREIYEGNVAAGWYSSLETGERIERNVGELLMLVVSELAEAAGGYDFDLKDDKLPHRKMVEVELADTKIRIHDIAGAHDLDLRAAATELLGSRRRPVHIDMTTPERLMLIVREVAGAMEGHRKNAMDEALPGRQAFEVRLAEALLQIHELGHRLGHDVDGAVVEKRAFNAQRADHKPENRKAEGGKAY